MRMTRARQRSEYKERPRRQSNELEEFEGVMSTLVEHIRASDPLELVCAYYGHSWRFYPFWGKDMCCRCGCQRDTEVQPRGTFRSLVSWDFRSMEGDRCAINMTIAFPA